MSKYNKSLDTALYRELRNDYSEDIFPKVFCKQTFLGTGNTFFSVKQIEEIINKYYNQCDKVAEILKKKSLFDTTTEIQNFLYNNFKYKSDKEDQMLRSPACSWKQRNIGIDCKSFTILAGSILKFLGYNFYIRQIKQLLSDRPNEFSHVYVIVPIDQKSNDLKKGYYVIDGTLSHATELPYIITSDFLVMKHYGLNGLRSALPVVPVKTPTIVPPNMALKTDTININNVSSTNSTNWWKRNNISLDTVLNRISQVSDLGTKIKNVFSSNSGVLPSYVKNEEDFKSYLSNISSNPSQQNEAQLNALLPLLLEIMNNKANNDNNDKNKYLPYIIGGGVLVIGLFAILLLGNKK